MLGETLKDSSEDHDQRAGHDTPPSTPALIAVGSNRDGEDRTELVAGGDKSEERWPDRPVAVFVNVSITEI